MDVEHEINQLKRRVSDLEGAVNVLAGELRNVRPDLERLRETTNERFDGVDQGVTRMVNRLDTLNTQVWSLRDDLVDLVGNAVMRALRPDDN